MVVEGAVEVAHGLAEAVFVFDQGDADVTFAVFPEGPAGGEGDFGFIHHAEAEIDGAFAGPEVGGIDFRPDEHGAEGLFVGPAEPVEAVADFIAAVLVDCGLLLGRLLTLAHGNDGGDLDGGEVAVVVVTFDGGKRLDHLGIAGAEADCASQPCCSSWTWW